MKNILLMTDFSENARQAIFYGIKLFGSEVEYILLNTYFFRRKSGHFKDISPMLFQESKDGLANELEQIKNEFPDYPNLKIKTISVNGENSKTVASIDKTEGIDLIIMGTKGASGFKKVVFGSVASSMIQNTPTPVLAVPSDIIYKPIKNIVYATNLEKNKNPNLTKPVKFLAKKYNAEINFLHVTSDKELTDELKTELKTKFHSNFSMEDYNTSLQMIEAPKALEGIKTFCENNHVDILTVVPRHKSFFDRLFHKSVTQELAFNIQKPLLALDNSIK